MKLSQLRSIERRLSDFVEEFAPELGRAERRFWCKQYLTGLILDGERKSIEPLASRVPGGNEQSLQQFVNQSPWAHEPVQEKLLNRMHRGYGQKPGVLVLDDTSFPKQGKASVGVAHQYCGALGKVANCQVAVTWHYCGAGEHFPLLGELFLPQSWIDEAEKLEHSGVPEAKRKFREKWRIALELLDRLRGWVDYQAIVVDAGYGEIRPFLHQLDRRDQTFVAQIPEHHCFWPAEVAVDEQQKPMGRPRQFQTIAERSARPLSAKAWREQAEQGEFTWRPIKLPSRRKKTVAVAVIRVRETTTRAWRRPGPARWLLIERHGDGSHKYYLSNAPAGTSVKRMILWAHQRWKIEQGYQQMKEELGLDHFEGRSWRGFHHHLTLCFLAYCFLKLIRRRKKSRLDAAWGEEVAESTVEFDAVSEVSGVPCSQANSFVQLSMNYLTE
jgi:SRSO17 transposase